MRLNAETRGDYLLLRLEEDRLDAAISIQFKDAARGMIAGSSGDVVLDLAQVGFMDSSGLGAVVAVMKLVGAERGFALAGATPNVARVLRLTRMDSVIRCIEAPPGDDDFAPHQAQEKSQNG